MLYPLSYEGGKCRLLGRNSAVRLDTSGLRGPLNVR